MRGVCACSRGWPPARPTATRGWPAARPPPCCTSGPGLGNGLANLHNARRAHTPVVNIVGDHATYHKRSTPRSSRTSRRWPARSPRWYRMSMRADDVGADAADAVAAALGPPGCGGHAGPAGRRVVVRAAGGPAATRAPLAAGPRRRPPLSRRRPGPCPRVSRRPSCSAAGRPAPAGLDGGQPRRRATGARLLARPSRRTSSAARGPRRRAARLPRRVRRGPAGRRCATWCWPRHGARSPFSPTRASPAASCPTAARCTCWPARRRRRGGPRGAGRALGAPADGRRGAGRRGPELPSGALDAETLAAAVGRPPARGRRGGR